MNSLREYIFEKFKISKDIKNIKDPIIRFMIVYSEKGKTEYRMFGNYDSAKDFAKHDVFFLDGYCLTEDEFVEILDSVIYKDFDNEVMYKDWSERLLNYTKEKNIMRLFDYEKS